MAGYIRVDTSNNIADGNIISASDLDNEFDGVQAAFNASTGHNHDGTTGEGAPILVLGPAQDVVVGASTVTPKTTNTVDIGSGSLKFKDLYLAGNASIAGTLGVTGATTLSAALTYGGVTLSNAVTGTGNMVLSASPTLTGTISGANASLSGTLAVTGVATLTAQPILSSLTASRAVFTDGSKGLVSNAITGTGNVVMSASPTLTGTITAEALTTSGTVTHNGGTANGVAYLNGSKVLTTGSALTFDGTRLSVGSGNSTAAGLISGYFGASGYGAIWSTSVTPSTSNFAFLTNASSTVLNGSSNVTFQVNNADSMALTSTGLGIGTSSPGAKLELSQFSTTTPSLRLRYSSTSVYSDHLMNGGGDYVIESPASNGVTSGNMRLRAGTNFSVSTNNNVATSPQLLLDSSGNLGLGVTPSASSSLNKAFDFNTTGGIGSYSNSTSTQFTYVSSNAFLNSSANFAYKFTGVAAAAYLQGNNTGHAWFTAPSGTAGNAITFTQAMTLDASARLSLGTTTASTGFASINLSGGPTGANTGIQLNYNSGAYGGGAITTVNAAGGGMSFYTFTGNVGSESYTERARITSGGYFKASNVGTYNDATGNYHEFRGDTANSYVVVTTCTNATPLSEYIQDFRFSAATPNDGNARFWSCTDATAERAYIRSNGGLSNYSANDTNLSDRREKTNFAPATAYLDKICAIPVQTFNYIDQNMEDDGGLTLGVVAQDVQAVAPELVTESNWGSKENPKMRLSIYQTDLQYALMKALQELKAEFDAYKASHP